MNSYQQLKRKLLRNKGVKKAYKELEPEFKFIRMMIQKRIEKGFTQKELAQKIGTKQTAISRLESGAYNPTVSTLRKVANALGAKVEVSIK